MTGKMATWATALFFVLPCAASQILYAGGQTPDQALAKLTQQRLKAARDTYASLQAAERRNARAFDPEVHYLWSKRILAAELEMAGKKGAAVAFKAHHERMVELERQTNQWVRLGQIGTENASAAIFYRTDAEILWERAKAK
jgi:hypothetical protein